VLVQLIDERAVHALAVEASLLRGDRLEEAAGPEVHQVVDLLLAVHLQALLQVLAREHHVHGVAILDLRLVLHRGGGVDLGVRLAVGGEHVEADAGGERRLAVALADLHERRAEAPRAVLVVPAEDRPDDEGLRDVQHERPRARRVDDLPRRTPRRRRPPAGEARRGKVDRADRALDPPHQAAGGPVHQVIEVALACRADLRARDDLAADDGARVDLDRVGNPVSDRRSTRRSAWAFACPGRRHWWRGRG
jgi:hypothetical protein